jgi:peptide/nickel transport system permease protein
VQVLEQRYHLNEPFLAQYWYWLGNALHGNLGISVTLRENVSTLIASRIWTTAGLVLYASLIIVVVGVCPRDRVRSPARGAHHQHAGGDRGLGGCPRLRRRDRADPAVRGEAQLVPRARERHRLPGQRQALHAVGDRPGHGVGGHRGQVTRAAVRAEGDREHAQTAISRGIPARCVIWRHIVRNAAIPITTITGITIASPIAVAAVVEVA